MAKWLPFARCGAGPGLDQRSDGGQWRDWGRFKIRLDFLAGKLRRLNDQIEQRQIKEGGHPFRMKGDGFFGFSR
jgi:hypothetical protein